MKHVSGKELCRALERQGWSLVRTRSSHRISVSPDGRTQVSVPVHGNKTLPTGTQRALMRDAGLTDDDL